MRMLKLFIFLLASSIWADPLLGVVVEEGTDRPIPYAEILYVSGKSLGQADRRGHFELQVERRNSTLKVVRPGYDTSSVDLQDYADLLDVVITMRSSVRELAQTTVRAKLAPKWQAERDVPMARLEDAAGLRFDLAEHLSQLPGVSGQRDFSSELSYDGSRSEEVAYHLGDARVPNMRHLDVGFPGNLSVINPHVLRAVAVHDQYATGPVEQGLASSIQFIPDPGSSDEFKFRGSAGTTVREVYASGPWLFWDAFTVSFRWLDPSMLKNMGEKFFTEFSKRDQACVDCQVKGNDAFDLKSWDFYGHLSGGDSSGNKWGVTGLLARDDYAIRQDTSNSLESVNSATLVKGSQSYTAVSTDYSAAGGLSWHMSYVDEETAETLRDTIGFRTDPDQTYQNFIDGTTKKHSRSQAGADGLIATRVMGAEASWAGDYVYHNVSRTWTGNKNGVTSATLSDHFMEGLGRLTWKPQDQRISLGGGAVGLVATAAAPVISLDWERRLYALDGLRIFGNSAWRSDYAIDPAVNGIDGILISGASAKLGLGLDQHSAKSSIHGFVRYLPNPQGPEPKAFWYYRELNKPNYAWVTGASGTTEFRTSHHVSLQGNLSSVYGEYAMQNGGVLAWPSNVRLEMATHLRIYPRSDSLLSLIISHRVAWHRPLYSYAIQLLDPASGGTEGTRSVRDAGQFTDLYRTDFRLNLDLKSSWKPLEDLRFYLEADNIFSPFGVNALKWLGSDNARERSEVTMDNDANADNGLDLVPFLAKGMGLYLQFGIESNLGF